MAKLDRNEIYKNNKKKVTYKLLVILVAISLFMSLVFIDIIGDKKKSVAFSDNMFFAGTLLFGLSIVIHLVKNIYLFRNRKLFDHKNINIDGETIARTKDGKQVNVLLKYDLLIIISRSFLIAGIISILISFLLALIV